MGSGVGIPVFAQKQRFKALSYVRRSFYGENKTGDFTMALGQIDFRWRPAQVNIDPNVRKEMPNAMSTIASSIAGARQSARNEEDRQRRIAEEERQKAAYGKIGDALQGNIDVAALRAERASLVAKLQELGG